MTVSIGFLGAGNIARLHLRGVEAALDAGVDARLGAIFDPEIERAHQRVEEFGGRVAGSVAEVIEHSDAVYVCTWTSEHEALVARVVDAGRAVFCEKPLGLDLASARRITDRAERAGVVAQVGLVLRRSPAFDVLTRLVRDPAAGDVMAVVFRDDQCLPVGGRYGSDWRVDAGRAGRGVLMEHSIHDVDLLEQVGGPIVEVAASLGFHRGLDPIEDVADVALRFASGATGSLVTTWHDVASRPSQRLVEVHCRNRVVRLEGEWTGTVEWEDGDGVGRLAGDDLLAEARRHRPDPNPDRGFLEAVVAGAAATPSLRDALRAHEVVDAAYRAARSDRWERVPAPRG